MAGDRVAAPPSLACGRSHHIQLGPVVLQKIEIDGGEIGQRMAQIAHRGDGFQENFGQHHRRADVEIDAAIVEVRDQRAEQAEIAMRGGADGGADRPRDACAACRFRSPRAR